MAQTKVPRYIKDGKVAVLYSPGFGAGWATWNDAHAEVLMFHKELVQAVLDNASNDAVKAIVKRLTGEDIYMGGWPLDIEWVSPDDRVRINEDDGSESVDILGPDTYFKAGG